MSAVKYFALPEGLLNAVGAYLQTKPFNEVADMLNAIRSNIVEVPDPKAPKNEKTIVEEVPK